MRIEAKAGGAPALAITIALLAGACDGGNETQPPTESEFQILSLESVVRESQALQNIYYSSDLFETDHQANYQRALELTREKLILLTDVNTRLEYSSATNTKEFTYRGARFDMSNSTDQVIGISLVDKLFQDIYTEDDEDQNFFKYYQRHQLNDIENLLWLKDKLNSIEVGGVNPIIRTQSLEELALGLKALESAGIELPTKAKIGFFDPEHYANEDDSTILLDASFSRFVGDFSTWIAIGEFVVATNPQLVENYEALADVAQIEKGAQIPYGDLLYDYQSPAQIIAEFMFEGVSFRKRIEFAKESHQFVTASILQANYDWAQRSLGDSQFSGDVHQTNPHHYEIGEIVDIDDYEAPRRPGIFLRAEPVLELNPEWPSVNNRSIVQIIDGPVRVNDDNRQETTTFWKVKAGHVNSDGIFISSAYDANQGWVSEEWFGGPLTEIPNP